MKKVVTLIVAIFIMDMVTKVLASTFMVHGDRITVIPGFFDITYLTNPGAAFSLFANTSSQWITTKLLAVVSVAVMAFIAHLIVSEFRRSKGRRVSKLVYIYALIFTGATGNFVDRLFRGEVVDFILVHYQDRYYYPAFNVADSAVTVGIILLALYVLRDTFRRGR